MEKCKENFGICGNFIIFVRGNIHFFIVYLRHICFIFNHRNLCAELLVTSALVKLIRF